MPGIKIADQPVIYEINTAVFVLELSRKLKRKITLANVPAEEWDRLASLHIDAVWFMGVWQRSPAAQAMAHHDPNLKKALPSLQPDDILGSAYSIYNYVVDDLLGSTAGLAKAREQLAKRGIGIILDYAPNHVALDHPWTNTNPEYFIHATEQDIADTPNDFVQRPVGTLAKGKDPNFEPWSDVAQLNAFSTALRIATTETLQKISDQCDGVRCDMAMLMINQVFSRTWGERAGAQPDHDFWPAIIAAVHKHNANFTFIAEVYWGLDKKLLEQGFDFCYDKDFYDALVHGTLKSIHQQLHNDLPHQRQMLRFIENHDEPRAAATFHRAKHEAAAVIMATTVGAKLYHEGQFEGAQTHVPVHLGRKRFEPVDEKMHEFYVKLTKLTSNLDQIQNWQICTFTSWFLFPSTKVMGWSVTAQKNDFVVVVNYSPERAKGRLTLPAELVGRQGEVLMTSKRRHINTADNLLSGKKTTLSPWEFYIIRVV